MNKHFWCFFISKNIEIEVVSCIQCQRLCNIQKDKFNKSVNEEKGKIHRSSIYNGYWNFSTLYFFLPKLSIYFTKIVFKGTATINQEKHMLKTCNQDNTKIENYFSIEFWNSNSFHIENKNYKIEITKDILQ